MQNPALRQCPRYLPHWLRGNRETGPHSTQASRPKARCGRVWEGRAGRGLTLHLGTSSMSRSGDRQQKLHTCCRWCNSWCQCHAQTAHITEGQHCVFSLMDAALGASLLCGFTRCFSVCAASSQRLKALFRTQCITHRCINQGLIYNICP